MSDDDTCYSLYGSTSGDWCIVVSPVGFIPPPRFGGLWALGDPGDAFRGLTERMKDSMGRRFPAQQTLARLLGVSQQEVSRWATSESQPSLSRHAVWRRVATIMFAWTEWPAKPVDEAAVRAFIAECTKVAALEAIG